MESRTSPSHDLSSDAASVPAVNEGKPPLLVRILKNPIFLVIFTWMLMAFLLAFEVSGK